MARVDGPKGESVALIVSHHEEGIVVAALQNKLLSPDSRSSMSGRTGGCAAGEQPSRAREASKLTVSERKTMEAKEEQGIGAKAGQYRLTVRRAPPVTSIILGT